MKIALISVSSPLKDGGAAESTWLISTQLRKRGYHVDVYSTTGDEKNIVQESENIYKIPSGTCYNVPKRVGANITTYQYSPNFSSYDIIHIYGPSHAPGTILRNLLSKTQTPILCTINNLGWVCVNGKRYLQQDYKKYGIKEIIFDAFDENHGLLIPAKIGLEVIGKQLTKQADHFSVQTTGMKQVVMNCGYDGRVVDVVPNLIDKNFITSSQKPENTLLFVGRLLEKKGVRDILEAFLSIEATLTKEWQFKIFGDGPLKKELTERARNEKNVSINYCPYQELPDVYRNASVLVHGSKYPEPFSRTWLEAMASETAIVASRNPSSEAVLGDFAELYDPFDAADLQESLRKVLEDKTRREKMRTEGKRQIDQYQPETVVDQYVKLYNKLV